MQGLDAKSVAGQQQAPVPYVINCKGEHATQLLNTIASHLLVKMDNHLSISVGAETMASAFELPAKLQKVINLSVVHNANSLVFVENRLVTSGKVDYTEPAHAQAGAVLYKNAFVIGPAMDHALAHSADGGCFNSSSFRVDHPSNSAHGYRFTAAWAPTNMDSGDILRVRLRR